MKKIQMLFTGIACLVITASFCQNDNKTPGDKSTKKKLKVTDASFSFGGAFQKIPIGSLADFQKMNPQSVLLKENLQGYSSSKGFSGFNSPAFIANLGFTEANRENTNTKSLTQYRLGISFSETGISNYLHKTDRKPYDTLTSSQTGQTMYFDSVTYQNYSMNYKSQELRLDLSVIYRTNPAARWSVYGGIGVEAGVSALAYTDIDYSEHVSIQTASSSTPTSDNNNYNNSDSYRSERLINKNSKVLAFYLPLGIDFRVGAKKEFFKQLHLFYEARPFVNYTETPELGSLGGVGVKVGFGLRLTI